MTHSANILDPSLWARHCSGSLEYSVENKYLYSHGAYVLEEKMVIQQNKYTKLQDVEE